MAVGDETNIVTLIRALMGPVQQMEDALQQLFTERRVDTAVGEQLNVLGRLVGQPRVLPDLVDDGDYRRYVRARIFTNRSSGLPEDLIKIAKLVLNDDEVYIHVSRSGDATVVVDLRDKVIAYAIGQVVRDFLKGGVSGGVRLIIEFVSADPLITFSFAGLTGVDGPGQPFGTHPTGTDGGQWSAAVS